MDTIDSSSSGFETSEIVATFLGSTPLLKEAWRLCSLANTTAPGRFLTERIGNVGYVAFSDVQVVGGSDPDPETLVALDLEGGMWKELFGPLTYPCDEDDVKSMMFHKGSLQQFLEAHSSSHLENQINALGNCKSIVVTGHSIGATTASFTTLWLLSHPPFIKSDVSVLCITFGSPLLGNDSLNQAILRNRWDGNFLHMVAKHDFFQSASILARQIGEHRIFRPFGSYLFCSDDGALCVDDATSIVKLIDLRQMASSNIFGMEDHLKISSQFFKIERFKGGGRLPESSYEASVSLALHSSGISIENWTNAKEQLELSWRMGRALRLNSASYGVKLSNITPYSAEIEWYKKYCDESLEEKGYYDTFRSGFFSRRETKVDHNRIYVGKFWDEFIDKVERKELPNFSHWPNKWVYASRTYTLLFEPLEIAAYYRFVRKQREHHYMSHGRESRFKILNKWWRQRGLRKDKPRSKKAGLTQDSCFWAKVEEAKEWLYDAKSVGMSDLNKLEEKVTEFEKFVEDLKQNMEVSEDVFAKNSSYSLWVTEWSAFKAQLQQIPVN